MPKPISAAAEALPVRVTLITLNGHMAAAVAAAEQRLRADWPGLSLSLHAATAWDRDPEALARCRADIARADILFVNMMFLEPHIEAVRPALTARRDSCDALVACMSAGEVIRLTRLGRFSMDKPAGGALSMLKRLRGSKTPGADSGAKQLAMLRRLPKLLRFVPGTAQDVRAYFLALQYWLAGSEENLVRMVRLLVGRYAAGPRAPLRQKGEAGAPVTYPEVGLYHPALPERLTTRVDALPRPAAAITGTVGLLVMRSYVLSGDTAHYDGVIAALEARGLRVLPAFTTGLDSRLAVQAFFMRDGRPAIDALVSVSPPQAINSIKRVLKSRLRMRLAPYKARGTDSATKPEQPNRRAISSRGVSLSISVRAARRSRTCVSGRTSTTSRSKSFEPSHWPPAAALTAATTARAPA